MSKKNLRNHWPFIVLCSLFTFSIVLMACTWFRHYMSPDTTSYFTIAAKYARFDFHNALNGYWGPLLSWLLVPGFWMHIDPIITAKLVGALAGLSLLVTTYIFMLKRSASKTLTMIVCILMALFLVQWITVGPITPDILLALFVVLFGLQLVSFIEHATARKGITLGALGALLYFSKGFGFYLFLAIMALVTVWKLWQTRGAFKQIMPAYGLVFATFFMFVLPFIGLISLKYHALTINTAGAYNQHMLGPDAKGVQPMTHSGPLAPPNNSAISVWENPAATIPLVPDWSPLDSGAHFHYFLSAMLGRNLNYTIFYLSGFGAFVTIGVIAMYVGVGRRSVYRAYYVIFSIISTVTILVYATVLTEPRYLLGVALLGIISGGLWLVRLEANHSIGRREIVALGLIFGGLIGLQTGQQLASFQRIDEKNWLYAQQRVETLKPLIPKGSRAISDTFSSYYTCYGLDIRCYSVLETPPAESETAYIERLQAAGIQYFINYHNREDPAFRAFIANHFTPIGETRVGSKQEIVTTVYTLN